MEEESESQSLLSEYSQRQHLYKRLAEEVRFGLERKLASLGLKLSGVISRVKSLHSLDQKVRQKGYQSLDEIPDLAGVRVLGLFTPDLDVAYEAVIQEFQALESVDKTAELGPDRMGYQGIHTVVTLGGAYAGPRYDDLRGLKCEVQIRTVLQDSWSQVSHALVYKQESETPGQVQRQLNLVSAQIELAQTQFDQVQATRNQYQASLVELPPNHLLRESVNYDSLQRYTEWKYPDKKPSERIHEILVRDLDLIKYQSLQALDDVVEKAKPAVEAYAKERPDIFNFGTDYITKSLGFVDLEFRRRHPFARFTRAAFDRLGHLVKSDD
jgi:ppGpp synthetase/RelA/SpoT-type nucleotidyltranferase